MIYLTCAPCHEEFPCSGGVMAWQSVYAGGPRNMVVGIGCSLACAKLIEIADTIAREHWSRRQESDLLRLG